MSTPALPPGDVDPAGDVIDVATPLEYRLLRAEITAAVIGCLVAMALLAAGWFLADLAGLSVWVPLAIVLVVIGAGAGVGWRGWREDTRWVHRLVEGTHGRKAVAVWLVAVTVSTVLALVHVGASVRLLWDLHLPWWALVLVVAPPAGAVSRLWPERHRLTPHWARWHGVVLRRLESRAVAGDTVDNEEGSPVGGLVAALRQGGTGDEE